jgi:hypothetical protein
MGALLVLSLKDNRLGTKEGGKALAHALTNSCTLKELDVSSNNCGRPGYGENGDGPGFVLELIVGLTNNRTITSLNLSRNNIGLVDHRLLFQKDLEALLQSYGVSVDTLKEHLEQPKDRSTDAIVSMVSGLSSCNVCSLPCHITYHRSHFDRLLLPLRKSVVLSPRQNYLHALRL